MLKAKSGRTQTWLPSQVAYGVDTSDPDPQNWRPFGDLFEAESTTREGSTPSVKSKVGPPAQ